MNSYYLFLTLHGSRDIDLGDVWEAIHEKFPDFHIAVSDEEFQDER